MLDALIDRLYFIATEPTLSRASADDIRRAALMLARKESGTTTQAHAPARPEAGELKPLPRRTFSNNDHESDGA